MNIKTKFIGLFRQVDKLRPYGRGGPIHNHSIVRFFKQKSNQEYLNVNRDVAISEQKRKELDVKIKLDEILKSQEKTTTIKRTSFFRGEVEQKIDKSDIIAFQRALRECQNKEGFINVIIDFMNKDRLKRGHLSFIYTSMEYIDLFGLEKDLDAYNWIFEVLPKFKIVNRTLLDALWPKPYPQIDAALDLLTKMEDNGIRPDDLTYTILLEAFGRASLPVQKAQRMAYWFDKFRDANPYLLPDEDLKDRFKVSQMALQRMTIDEECVKVYLLKKSENTEEQNSFLIGSQNEEQKEFISSYDTTRPLYIEGPYNIWMNHIKEQYYLLRSDSLFVENPLTHEDDTRIREGMVLGICMTNFPIRDALESWLKYLQTDNPRLSEFKIIFNVDIPSDVAAWSQ